MVPEKSDSLLHNYPIIDLNTKLKLSVLCVHIGNKLSNSSDCFKTYIICNEIAFKTAYEYKDRYY